jgi:uncharacterized protein (DUF488 family)
MHTPIALTAASLAELPLFKSFFDSDNDSECTRTCRVQGFKTLALIVNPTSTAMCDVRLRPGAQTATTKMRQLPGESRVESSQKQHITTICTYRVRGRRDVFCFDKSRKTRFQQLAQMAPRLANLDKLGPTSHLARSESGQTLEKLFAWRGEKYWNG